MTTPKAPSVINPDIPPPPLPGPTIPPGNRSLSPDNSSGASTKHLRTVYEDAMDIEKTSTPVSGFNPGPTVPTGLPVNKVAVITQPPVTNTRSLDFSIHAHPIPTLTTVAPQDDKGKSIAFAILERQPFPDGSATTIKSAPSHYHAAAYLRSDLLEIATQVNAKALNVPLSVNSYKPKPYVYLNFSLFDTLEATKDLSVAFCGKVDDRLNKLYSRFNAGPRRGHQNLRQSRDKSNSWSRSRSTSRSRNNSSSSKPNNNYNNINTSHPNVPNRNNQTNNNNTNSRNNVTSSGSTQSPHMLHPNSSTSTFPSNNPTYTLPQHIIDDLRTQISKIANTLSTLDETVSWMQDTIAHYEYRLTELESMMGYDNPNNANSYSPPDDTEQYPQDVGWDNEPSHNTSSRSNLLPYTSSSLMDTSPDASFSALDPNSVLSNRHVPLPSSRPNTSVPDATASRLQLEISNITNVYKNLSAQLENSPP
ncbi:hypothetical protein GLOIN_2v1785090 [Rhizophagus irregularis DAOM 181602=DAOM 197198]|nr:hypothetical protein GLOIN_2v1785090 [Rhizophagus irregularis DAOM 181602=DAOM 197198]